MGHATHKDLHDGFTKATADLDISKMVQLSMDGPNVNWKFAECLFRDRNEIGLPDLINFVSSLHIVNGAFETGATATAWNLKKILKAMWQILHDSPARRDDFVSETDAVVYPLPFCGTRWVENKQVADLAFLVWSNIIKITKFWMGLPKYKQPKCKSFTVLTDSVFDLFMPAKLQFFSYVAGLLEPYLKRCQSDAPLVLFMYFDMKNLVTAIMKLFVKQDKIKDCKTASDLLEFPLASSKGHCQDKEVSLGFATENSLSELKKSDQAEGGKIKSFIGECRQFLITLLKKIFERSPLGSPFIRAVHILDPITMASYSTSVNQNCMKSLLRQLMSCNILKPTVCDKVMESFDKFLSSELVLHQEKFVNYKREQQRLDDFYFNSVTDMKKYPEFSLFLKLVFVLSHGQVAVERGFNLRDISLQEINAESTNLCAESTNISAESTNSRRIIIDHMFFHGLTPETTDIPGKLLLSVKSARFRYEEAKKEQRDKAERETKRQKLLNIDNDITELKGKIDSFTKVNNELDKEFEDLIFKADKSPDEAQLLVSKATAMKRKSNQNKCVVKKLEDTSGVLREKRKKLIH